MRLLIAAIGKLKQGPERELFAHYLGRAVAVGRMLNLAPIGAVEVAESKAGTASSRIEAEAKALLAKIPPSHRLLSLDRRGEALSSEDLAGLLAKLRDGGAEGVAFIIGGPDGLSAEISAKADKVISFGALTLPHGLTRIVLAEQIYRAATILTGHPYHRA
jgi:23S rRNA (pseudouridine1915-N3)-methyltransferase